MPGDGRERTLEECIFGGYMRSLDMKPVSIDDLLALFDSVYPMSEGLRAALRERTTFVTLDKKELLVREGQPVRHIYFILEGILRMYYLDDGREISIRLNKEGDVIFSVDAFYHGYSETVNIEAVEPCRLACLSFGELRHLFREFLELNYIARVLTDRQILEYERRLHILRRMSAKEKWQFFCDHYPDMVQRVPLIYIAGFLGLSMETLSRVRRPG